jgi:hypothetical protein
MKKLFTLFLVAGMFSFLACGPSAEEKAAIEKAKQDSIAAVEKAKQDSIAAVEQAKQDSINAAAEKAKQDSIAAAEAKAKKPAIKKTVAPKVIKKEDVKAGQGKNAK